MGLRCRRVSAAACNRIFYVEHTLLCYSDKGCWCADTREDVLNINFLTFMTSMIMLALATIAKLIGII